MTRTGAATQQLESFGLREEAIVEVGTLASIGQVGASSASTTIGRIRARVGGYVLPFAATAAAAVGSPVPALTRRFYR